MLGTLAAACSLYWHGYYWPEPIEYIFTPYNMLLLLTSHLFDLAYPFAFLRVRREEQKNDKRKLG